ncbi:MAG: alpha/beta hydrolase [Blastocatellia bacterium]|nr:alpha/beta hydrolase [Blastocatellia bacterium]
MKKLKRMVKWIGLAVLVPLVILLGLAFKPIPVTVEPIKPSLDTAYWQMKGGYRIAYHKVPTVHPPTKAPVIYLHGGPGGYIHSSVVKTLAPVAETGRELFFYDQSGCGLSDRRARPKDTTFSSHLTDLHEIVTEHLRVPKVVVIGHSYGGKLASVFAAQHPELIERLVLSSPGEIQPVEYDPQGRPVNEVRYPVPKDLHFTAVNVDGNAKSDTEVSALPVRAMVSIALAMLLNRKFASDRELDASLNSMASKFTRHMVCDPQNVQPEEGGGGAYMRGWSNFYGGLADPRPQMRKMLAPVLVLQGQCDFIPYSDAYEYAALFPKARYQFVPNAGHILIWDQPEVYRTLIRNFLEESAETK